MSLDNPNGIESSVSKNTKQRRKFLKRATAGAVIVSIPGRSAWATVNGSVVASGNGSNLSGGNASIALLSHGSWKQRLHPTDNNGNRGTHRSENVAFNSVFTSSLISSTFYRVLVGDHGNTPFQMVAMYLNAKYHGTLGLNFPVVGSGAPYADLSEFAAELWNAYLDDPVRLGRDLDYLINNNHV